MCPHPFPGSTAQKVECCSTWIKFRVCPPMSVQPGGIASKSRVQPALCLAQRAGMQECCEPECSAHSCWRRPKEKAGGWLTALPGEIGAWGEGRPRGGFG